MACRLLDSVARVSTRFRDTWPTKKSQQREVTWRTRIDRAKGAFAATMRMKTDGGSAATRKTMGGARIAASGPSDATKATVAGAEATAIQTSHGARMAAKTDTAAIKTTVANDTPG